MIGQTSFTTSTNGTTAATLLGPLGNAAADPATGNLFIGDTGNNRILEYSGVPTTSGASATLVLGQTSFTSNTGGTSATNMSRPLSPVFSGGELLFTDSSNERVGIYSAVPTTSPGTLSLVVGQTSMTSNTSGTTATTMKVPFGVSAGGGKMAVADESNNRVLLYNSIPTASGVAASFVLGQTSMTAGATNAGTAESAAGMALPSGVWTDGTRVVVVDTGNNRVLIWNSWPTANGQPADLVLGQTGFTSNTTGTSATTMKSPYVGVFVDSTGALLVTDSGNNRVLIWNTFPTANDQAADAVLGQAGFTSGTAGTSATTLNNPTGVTRAGGYTIVTDTSNNRLLVF